MGQTTETLHRRMIKHRSDARKYAKYVEERKNAKTPEDIKNCKKRNKRGTCSKLYAAMNDYGIENFHMDPEDAEEMDNALLNDAEMAMIEAFDSVKTGYNLKLGGVVTPIVKKPKNDRYSYSRRSK